MPPIVQTGENEYRCARSTVFPRIGTPEIAPSISEEFGEDVMRVVVKPFDLIYEYDEATDTVYLYGLIHNRNVH